MDVRARAWTEPDTSVAILPHSVLAGVDSFVCRIFDSDELLLYTNWLTQNHQKMPHYQDLLYEPAIVTNQKDYIVSFHPSTPITSKVISHCGQFSEKNCGW